MQITTSRQLKQPQIALVLQYNLLHSTMKESLVMIDLAKENRELCDFYEEDVL
jgi:hypothetical protein